MAIHLDVELDLDRRHIDRQADRLARDMERDFQRVGREVGNHFASGFEQATPRIEKAAAKASKATDNLAYREQVLNSHRQKAAGTAGQLEKAENALADARRSGTADADALAKMEDLVNRRRITHANTTKQAAKAQNDYADAVRNAAVANRALQAVRIDPGNVQNVANFGALVGNLGKAVGPIGGAALVSGIVQLGGVAAQASGSLALIPAILGGVVAGFGTAKIATLGFSDALESMGDPEKFAESLNSLSPSAAQAAQSIKGLVNGPMRDLRLSTQQAFFDNVGPQLEQLSAQFAPALQQMTTGVAGSLNGMMSGVMGQLATPETAGAIEQTMTNISTAFQNLAPAAAPLTQAFAELTAVGSDFLPEIASAATEAAQSFSAFIAESSKSGELESFIRGGLDALKEIGPILGSVKDMFFALAPIGADVLPGIRTAFEGMATVLPPIVDAVVDIKDTIEIAQGVAGMFFGDFESGSQVFTQASDLAVRAFDRIRGAMDTALTPIRKLIDLYNALPFGDVPNIPSLTPTGRSDMPTPDALGGGANASRDRRGLAPVAPRGTTAAPDFAPGIAGNGVLGGLTAGMANGWDGGGWNVTGPSSGGGGGSGDRGARGYSTGGYTSDQALLANVPAGIYSQTGSADLAEGVGDCTSAIEDLIALLDGRSTAGRSMSTGNAHEWLTAHGFLPGYMPGAFNVGFNSSHMQAELPGGTPFNWGSDSAAARGGVGGTGALDPAFTDHYYRPVADTYSGSGNQFSSRGTTPVSVEGFAPSAASQMQSSFTNKIDDDFGFSGGLPGIFENLFKVIANTAMAPVIGALTGVTAAYGTAGPGSGLLGSLQPRQNVFGQSVPNIFGDYGQTASTGYSPSYGSPSAVSGGLPGPGLFGGANSTQTAYGTPASGVGLGPLPGPGFTPGASPISLQTGVAGTETRGIPHGQGVHASEGIGIGGGLIGAAQSMGGGMGGAAMSAGAQVGIDLINRTIGLGGQLAGNAVSGLMETFLPVESELADPSRGWFGRILGAVAGVKPAAENLAGGLTEKMAPNENGENAPPLTPQQVAAQEAAKKKGEGGGNTTTINNTVVERENRNDYSVAKDMGYHTAKAIGN